MWFDGQAEEFDRFAGLEPAAGQSIVQAIRTYGGAGRNLVLDLGAGTGAVGGHFAELDVRYVGLDRSRAMLHVFQQKLTPWPAHMLLVQADSDRPWPIGDQAVTVILASRVAHHLQAAHLLEEVFRVGRPGGYLLLGQIIRDPESLPSRLQAYKRSVLGNHGVQTRRGADALEAIIARAAQRGAQPAPPRVVAEWTRSTTARRLLDSWERKPQLNSRTEGMSLNAAQRLAIVAALHTWVEAELGALDQPHEVVERYTLQALRLP